jgi:hypothetical protein
MVDQKLIDRAIKIWDKDDTPDGTPYLPSNGSEGEIFQAHWCHQCAKDSWGRGGEKTCKYLSKALCGEAPKVWVYQSGAPLCTAFKHYQDSSQSDHVVPGQLSLLDYVPTPEEIEEPQEQAPPSPSTNPHSIAWYQARADYYLRLISRFVNSDRIPKHVKRFEISRAYQLREQAIANLKEVQGC